MLDISNEFVILVNDLSFVGSTFTNNIYARYRNRRFDQVLTYEVELSDICEITTFIEIPAPVAVAEYTIIGAPLEGFKSPRFVPETSNGCVLDYDFDIISNPLVESALTLDKSDPLRPEFDIYSR